MPLWGAAILLFLVMAALELLYFQRLSGGLATLGVRPLGFTTEQAVAWFTALGEPGREAVLVWKCSSFGLVFPAVFALALAALLLHAAARGTLPARLSRRGQLFAALVLVLPYGVASYAQNFIVAHMLSDPSSASVWMVSLASRLVIAKHLFAVVPLGLAALLRYGRARR